MSTRLFVSGALSNAEERILHGEPARYLGRALRARVGDEIRVFNGEGGEWWARISKIGKSEVVLEIGEHIETAVESPLKVHLVQGISRGERMDFVVQKATELGVKRITPVLTNHGVVKLDAKRAGKRRDHWQQVANSASEQSGRTRPPLIDAALDLNQWFGQKATSDTTELILQPGAASSMSAIEAPTRKLCLLIGPEGGFSDKEYEDAELSGFRAVSLGPRILRTETAALAALALAQASWGDFQA
jgi:16S rRNA (uracil1498-N3)-methyltransferase